MGSQHYYLDTGFIADRFRYRCRGAQFGKDGFNAVVHNHLLDGRQIRS